MSVAAIFPLPKATPGVPRRSPLSQRAVTGLPTGQKKPARSFSNAGGRHMRAPTGHQSTAASTIQRPAKHPMPLGQRKFAGHLSRSANTGTPTGLYKAAEQLSTSAKAEVPSGQKHRALAPFARPLVDRQFGLCIDAGLLFGRPSEDCLRAFAVVPTALHSWRAYTAMPDGLDQPARQPLLRTSP